VPHKEQGHGHVLAHQREPQWRVAIDVGLVHICAVLAEGRDGILQIVLDGKLCTAAPRQAGLPVAVKALRMKVAYQDGVLSSGGSGMHIRAALHQQGGRAEIFLQEARMKQGKTVR
jgi:hypothetical protein